MRIPKTLAMILAGGSGSRLGALTQDRVKPALPMGGNYRLIDISLSNLVHSHITDVRLAVQYLPQSLINHLAQGRPWDLDRNHGGLQVVGPFEGGAGEGFARGNSDTLHRQRSHIAESGAELVLVMSADHLYTLNFLDVVSTHLDRGADLTMVVTRVDEQASRYGVVEIGHGDVVTGFEYKPDKPTGDLVSAEIFLYSAPALLDAMDLLMEEHGQLGDYGEDLVPWFVGNKRTVAHHMIGYWMDVGTLQSYWTAHLQLLDGEGVTLDDPEWPIFTAQPQLLPALIEPTSSVARSMVASGARVAGEVHHSVVGPSVVIEEGALVRDSVVLDGARIASGVELTNCIVDVGAQVERRGAKGSPEWVTLIGHDGLVADRVRFDRSSRLPRGF